MKKLFSLILLVIGINLISYSQCPENGQHVSRPDLDKFVGTWTYNSNGTEATIILKKIHSHFVFGRLDYWEDRIFGVLKVISNKQVVFDNTSEFSNTILLTTHPKLILDYDCMHNLANKIKGTLGDVVKEKNVDIELEFTHGNPAQIFVVQSNPERFGLLNEDGTYASHDIRNTKGTFDPDFTLPTNAFFIKQR